MGLILRRLYCDSPKSGGVIAPRLMEPLESIFQAENKIITLSLTYSFKTSFRYEANPDSRARKQTNGDN